MLMLTWVLLITFLVPICFLITGVCCIILCYPVPQQPDQGELDRMNSLHALHAAIILEEQQLFMSRLTQGGSRAPVFVGVVSPGGELGVAHVV